MKNKKERKLKTELQEIYLITDNAKILEKLKNSINYFNNKIKN